MAPQEIYLYKSLNVQVFVETRAVTISEFHFCDDHGQKN